VWGPYLLNLKPDTSIENVFKDYNTLLEKLHSKFCKHTLLVHKYTSNIGVRAELGRFPLINILKNVTNYYINLSSRQDGIVNEALQTQKVLSCISNGTSWYSLINFLEKNLNWKLNPLIVDNNVRFSPNFNLSKYLRDQYIAYFPQLLQSDSKLIFYSQFKKQFGLENYLTHVKHSQERKAITKLRISAHQFPIETGRYNNTARKDRMCTLCNSGIGDEKHYFTRCRNENIMNLRESFKTIIVSINKTFANLSTENIFIYSMCLHDKNIIKTTATFILKMLETYCNEVNNT
jgi:hypothetical protein